MPFRRAYGAGPLHLLMLLGCFALTGYVISLIVRVPLPARIVLWFVGAAILHDFVLWPGYTVADRLVRAVATRRGHRPHRLAVPVVNHVRVPAFISACLLAVSFPLVFGWSGSTYTNATGLSPSPYPERWLAITGALFAASGLVYLARVLVVRRGAAPTSAEDGAHVPDRADGTPDGSGDL